MRIICLIVFLSLCGGLYADDVISQQVDNEPGKVNVEQASYKKEAGDVVSVDEIKSERTDSFIKKSALLPESKLTTKSSVSTLFNWPMVLLMLFGIVCLILGLAWFVKRFGGFTMAGGRDMRVLSSLPLGARERVALIDVQGQQFLIGVTTQNINHLHTFDEPVIDTSNSNTTKSNASSFQKSDFAKKLQQLLTTTKSSSDERV
ncbi:MAG: flagellar biosynthetic protein FliO [Pseudohongiellaceae bacterium]